MRTGLEHRIAIERSLDGFASNYWTALSGAGNFFTILFPLIAGALISAVGYPFVFGISIVITATSLLFVNQLNCRQRIKTS